jgi:hypothetical protein
MNTVRGVALPPPNLFHLLDLCPIPMLSRSRVLSVLLALVFLLTPFSLLVGPVSVAGPVEAVDLGAIPVASDGYGYDPATATFVDHNGFQYSYLPDGVIKLVLPWGYTTYFSFGLTATYLGVQQKVTALSYTWTWAASATAAYNETGVLEGYDYTFTATNSATLAWTIQLEFYADGRNMKVTHTVRNGYPNALVGAEFWFLFDLTHTPSPSVTTNAGTFYPPLYSAIPDSITWCRLSNQFQFDWRDAGWPNGHAYLGSGSVVGLSIQILGIGLLLGDIPSGTTVTVDPYFSGVTRTWAATGNSYSGIAASWSPVGVPATGDNITFDATSTYNCNWNTTVTVGDFKLDTGYSGTVTQSVDFGVYRIYFNAGTFTTSTLYLKLTIIKASEKGAGTAAGNRINANFIGATCYMNASTLYVIWKSVTVNGNLSVVNPNYSERLVVQSGQTMTISTTTFFMQVDSGGSVICNGTIQTNTLAFYGTASKSISITGTGLIRSAVSFYITASASSDRTWTFLNDITILGHTMTVTSTHPTYTLTLSGGGYRLALGGTLAIGARANILQGIGAWSIGNMSLDVSSSQVNAGGSLVCRGSWSTSVSGFTPGTSTVYLTGAAKTVKTAAGGAFYDLVVGGSYTTSSSVNVTHGLQVNASSSMTIGAGKALTLTDASLTNLGTVIGTGSFVVGTSVDRTISPGVITTAPTTFNLLASATGSRTLSLGDDLSVGALLTVDSLAAASLSFDLQDYDLTTTTGADLVTTSDAYLFSGTGSITVDDDMTLGSAWEASGTTVSVTDILSLASATLVDSDISCGDLTASATLTTTNGSIATSDDLTLSGALTASGTDFAVDDDCTLAGASSVTGGSFVVDGDLNVTGSTTLNPDTLGLWALRVLGAGDLSVTTLSLETTQDLYVGPAASLTIADDTMTVGGNWTVLGTWARSDAVVVLTGTGDLEMDSDMSFWNITVALTATITMDNDTYVDLRATVLGSLLGTGDFIEPEPVFWSTPTLDAVPLEVYNYTISQGYWDTLTLVDAPSWLALYGSELKGVPTEADAGPVNVSLLLTWNDMETYQNYTLWVSYPVISGETNLVLQVIVAIIFALSLLVLGLVLNQPVFTVFSGIIFLWAGMVVFAPLDFGWTAISIMVGFATLILGGLQFGKVE